MSQPTLPTISIALATFNGERHLSQQLASYAVQTNLPFELVVSDDCSSDATGAIISDFAKHAPFPVKFFKNEVNLGYRNNFFKAASFCSGDVIAFSDQDDVWHPQKLERCAQEFGDPTVVMCAHNGELVDNNLLPQGLKLAPTLKTKRTYLPLTLGFDFRAHGMRTLFSAWMIRELDWGSRPPMLDDHDHWISFMAGVLGKVVHIPDNLIQYRRHGANTSAIAVPAELTFQRRLQLSKITSSQSYKDSANLARVRSDYLLSLTQNQSPTVRDPLLNAANCLRRLAAAYEVRSALHDPGTKRIEKFGCLRKLLSQASYSPQRKGGLGWRAAIKDISKTFAF